MGTTRSPLRYPGGKSKIYNNIRKLIVANGFTDRTYVEPFVGGFGVGIALLEDNVIERVIINDLDIHLYHFWDAVLHQTEALIDLVRDTPITLDERMRHKISLHHRDACELMVELLAEEGVDFFFNIDPPYVVKGKSLYSEYYTDADHRNLGHIIHTHLQNVPWVVTYDSCDLVREIYQDDLIFEYGMFHSAHNRTQGRELVITNMPKDQFAW